MKLRLCPNFWKCWTGYIITADAMSCQKEIVHRIAEKEADYVLGLKDNQPRLRRGVQEYFDAALQEPQNYPLVKSAKTMDSGHGRIEIRTYYLTTEAEWFESCAEWNNLRAFGMVHSRVEQQDRVTEDDRYYITSLTDIPVFADAARKHWGIENSLHWCLDLSFREDYSCISKNHSAENMAVVRHVSLNILKNHLAKICLARKCHRCAYDDNFFAAVINSVHALAEYLIIANVDN